MAVQRVGAVGDAVDAVGRQQRIDDLRAAFAATVTARQSPATAPASTSPRSDAGVEASGAAAREGWYA